MADTKRFAPWAVVLDAETAQAGTAVYINGIQGGSTNMNLVTRPEGGDGLPHATFASLVGGAPRASFSTTDIKTFLDECGVNGMLIDSGASGDGVIMYCQRYATGGTRMTTSVNHKTTFGDGMLVPRSISVSHTGTAVLSAEVIGMSSDGTTSPVTFDETAALPADYPVIDTVFSLGKWVLNSTTIEGITDVTYNFGITELVESADSNLYPTIVSIARVMPSITLSSRTVDLTTTLTEAGVEYATTQVVGYLKKKDEGGTYVADGTAEHIKFTLNKCRVEPVTFGGDPGNIGIQITPWYTNAGSPTAEVTISTASAIT